MASADQHLAPEMETPKESSGRWWPENGKITELCRSMSSSTLQGISTHDWMMEIISDKVSLGQNQSSVHSERGKNCKVFENLNQFIGFLMNHNLHHGRIKALLARNTEKDNQSLMSLLESAISSFEARIEGETPDDFELRRKEMSTEYRASFHNMTKKLCFDSQSLQNYLIGVYQTGDQQFRNKAYRQAYFSFNDAILAAQSRPQEHELCKNFLLDASAESEESKSDVDQMLVPHDTIYLELKMKQIECLMLDEQFKKVSVYANHLLNWMTKNRACGIQGYYASCHPDKYSLLQIWMGEAEVSLFNPFRAIDLCNLAIKNYCNLLSSVTLDQTVFTVRKTFLERLSDYFDAEEEPEDSIQADRATARIIVDPVARRGVSDGQFFVNDLDSGLRIAKNGDVIFIEEGNYSGRTLRQQSGNMKMVTEINKSVTLIGASAKKSVLSGSMVKIGSGELRLRRLKIEIGDDADSDADVYLMEGMTIIDGCVIECAVNTGFCVLSFDRETGVTFKHCIIDGLESCKRLVSFQGQRPIINVDSCYISDMYSFCTVLEPEKNIAAILTIADSAIYDVQDGIKFLVHPSSDISCDIVGCQFELVLYDAESTSHAVFMNAGSCRAHNNIIFANHIDPVGFSLSSMKRTELQMILIETTEETTRSFSLGQGVVLTNNRMSVVTHVEVIGLRCGFQIAHQARDRRNVCVLRDCSTKSCAIGILVREDSFQECHPTPTLRLNIFQCHLDTTHYGLMLESPNTKVRLEMSSFYDVPKPILVSKLCSNRVHLKQNEFKISKFFEAEAEDESDPESVRQKMFLHFATQENLPHRVAYENQDFFFVSSSSDENQFPEDESALVEA